MMVTTCLYLLISYQYTCKLLFLVEKSARFQSIVQNGPSWKQSMIKIIIVDTGKVW